MLDKFWESIGSNLAERWLEYIFGPAFLFWAAGLGIYVWQHDLENIQKTPAGSTASSTAEASVKKAERLCNYWTAQYKKEPTGLNEALKNKACARSQKLQSAKSSAE